MSQEKQLISNAIDIYVTLVFITLFTIVSFSFLWPFTSILLWAGILAISFYPLFLKFKSWFGGKSGLASALIAILCLIFILAPTIWLIQTSLSSTSEIVRGVQSGDIQVPPANPSVQNWPLIGNKAFNIWNALHEDLQETLQAHLPEIKAAATKTLGIGAAFLGTVLQFVLSILFAAAFLSYAGPLSQTSQNLARRIDKSHGSAFLDIAIATTRNVAKGVLGIAAIQGGLAAIGFFVAGFAFPGLWAIAALALSIVQFPQLIILPAIIYMWFTGDTVPAILFTAYMIPVMISDNFLKPLIMAKGLSTPMIIIFMGVIGGTISFGLLGLFIGPVVLSIFYDMIKLWTQNSREGEK